MVSFHCHVSLPESRPTQLLWYALSTPSALGPQGTKSGAFAAAQLGTEEKSGKDSPPTFFESRLSEEWREDTDEKCENAR